MNTLVQDGKKIIMKKVGYFCLFLGVLLVIIMGLWGKSMISLLKGQNDIKEYSLYETNTQHMEHAYIKAEIEMITGSYAQYGEMKEDEMNNLTVYYLMPVDDGNYFVSVIGHGDVIKTLDEMEAYFYDSIGEEYKTYPQPLAIQGGFKELTTEELQFALDYFMAYDSSIQSIEDLPTILSPYAIVIDEIGSVTISSLWVLWIVWFVILLILIICIILYMSKVFMRPLFKDINALPIALQKSIDEDYSKADIYDHLYIGKKLLYQKDTFSMHVYDYEQFIWLYQKEILGKKKRSFELCAYDKSGKRYELWQGNDQKRAEKLCRKIYDHCENAILGYERFLYEYWQKQPQQLYDKCMELTLIKEKMEAETTPKKDINKEKRTPKHAKKPKKQRKVKGKKTNEKK